MIPVYIIQGVFAAAIIYLFIKYKNIMLLLGEIPKELAIIRNNQRMMDNLINSLVERDKRIIEGVLPASYETEIFTIKEQQEATLVLLEAATGEKRIEEPAP